MTERFEPLLIGKSGTVRQFRERSHRVDRRIEDCLGPLCRSRIAERLSSQTAPVDQLGRFLYNLKRRRGRLEWPHPCGGVKFVLHMGIAVARAAHEGCSANDLGPHLLSDDTFASETVLRRKHRCISEYGSA